MRLRDLLKRTPVRLAAAFTILFILTVLTLFAVLYLNLGAQLEARVRQRIVETRDALVAIDRQTGFDDLSSIITDEAGSLSHSGSIFLLLRQGSFEAGNVRDVPLFEGWRTIPRASLPDISGQGDPGDEFFALWSRVSNGMLLIGGSDREIRESQSVLLRGFGWSLIATVLLATGSAVFLAHRAQQKIDLLANTLEAVARGDIASRVPLSGTDDDLDHVARQINATLGHLQRLIEGVNQTSSDIAHDLKKPIGRLRQRLDSARHSSMGAAELRQAMGEALCEIDSIVETFEALLRISQIEAGARKARFADVSLRAVLADLADVYEVVIEDAGHRLFTDLPQRTPAVVRGDRELLAQLFANLVENAIRHCPPGTLIRIGIEMETKGYTAIVADNGLGIPPSERQNVFRRLYRLERARSTPGSGLGLSLVAAIAELHGAAVELGDNKPGLIVKVHFPFRH